MKNKYMYLGVKINKLKIDQKTKEFVENCLKEVQKGCTMRLLTIEDILSFTESATNKLSIFTKKNLPKQGISCIINTNAEKFPNAYKYSPASTFFTITLVNGNWILERVYRSYQSTKGDDAFVWKMLITDEEKEFLKQKLFEYYFY